MIIARNPLVFGLGLASALLTGWVVFPHVLYVQRRQPLEFHHKTHAEKSGVTQCSQCHALRDDGAFVGIPPLETCKACHTDRMGTSKAEAILVDNYIKPGEEIPWRLYAQQPENVWFSHAVHVRRAALACTECHSTYGESDKVRIYEQDRISTYSRDVMKMSDCEDCHFRHNVEAGCLGCHK